MSKLLSPEMLKAVGAYTSSLEETVVLRLNIGEHDKKDELREFLGDLASTSDMLNLEEKRSRNVPPEESDADKDKYTAIGESDRMTLLFRKR